jgi:hypothetical protein
MPRRFVSVRFAGVEFGGAPVHGLAQRLARLEVGHRFSGMATCSPLRGLRPMRGGRRLIEKLPKPRISMRWPRASASAHRVQDGS